MAELEWPAQARSDVVRVVVRLESVLRFQLASALQTCINVILQSASRSDDTVLQLLLVGVVGVAAYQVQALLAKKSSE